MVYNIFTDGACNAEKGIISSAYLIKTNYKFISMGAVSFMSSYVTVAETVAIGLGVEVLLQKVELQGGDKVVIITDSIHAISLLSTAVSSKVQDPPIRMRDPRVIMTWYKLKELSCKTSWSFEKIKAHIGVRSGNTVVDRLVRHELRAQCAKGG